MVVAENLFFLILNVVIAVSLIFGFMKIKSINKYWLKGLIWGSIPLFLISLFLIPFLISGIDGFHADGAMGMIILEVFSLFSLIFSIIGAIIGFIYGKKVKVEN